MGFATTIVILNTLLGIAVAARYNVFALIPVAFVTMIATACVGAVCGRELSAILLMLFLALVGLQVGYVAGSGIFILAPIKRLADLFPAKNSAAASDPVA